MKPTTQSQILQGLREAARRRYGEARARELLPALRETSKAVWGTRNQKLALEDEPAFFIPSNRRR
jgi:hypothetical protein